MDANRNRFGLPSNLTYLGHFSSYPIHFMRELHAALNVFIPSGPGESMITMSRKRGRSTRMKVFSVVANAQTEYSSCNFSTQPPNGDNNLQTTLSLESQRHS
jgi:hypothetical protein